jgi:branched-subunit amino acid aminotransferase/4-amino-4-deoxychorismate lyase
MEDLRVKTVAAATAYPNSNVLPGITRAAVIELAESSGLAIDIRGLTINDVLEADEIFLTNSIMQVMPVCRVERRAVGDDKPGKITRQLLGAYRKLVALR